MRALIWFLAAAAAAQDLRIYSEFQRPDPFGEIAAPDRGARPREILSPAIPRNAWISFWLACEVPREDTATLHIQQNPEILETVLYRARFVETAKGWVPDILEKVPLPYVIRPALGDAPIPGQTTVVFLLDIRVPATVPPERMRLQADMWVRDRWLTYPMEIRIAGASVPGEHAGDGPLPPPAARADEALTEVLRSGLCGTAAKGRPEAALTARRLLRRNAQQDFALARERNVLDPGWCRYQAASSSRPPEWWLGVRTALYRNAP